MAAISAPFDPIGVHSAVLGMLSLSSGGGNPTAGQTAMFPTSEPPRVIGSQIPTQQHQQPGQRSTGHQNGLPLTPPGSPPEEAKPPAVAASALINCLQQPALAGSNFQQPPHQPQQNGGGAAGFLRSTAGFAELPSTSSSQLAAATTAMGHHSAGASLFSNAASSPQFGSFMSPEVLDNPLLATALRSSGQSKRVRGEKKPIPQELKDDKYYERRSRNNYAAKKSRDSRKQREDEVAVRAACLERENAILRAQVGTLREEAQNLRTLLLQKRQRQVMEQQAAAVVGLAQQQVGQAANPQQQPTPICLQAIANPTMNA